MLQACLGMKINAATNTITFCQPVLPSYLDEITITNLRLNNKLIILQIRRNTEGLDAVLLSPKADVEIKLQNKAALEPA